MPIEHALWRIDQKLTRLTEATLESERALEDYITSDIGILNERWMLIGRQVRTDFNKAVDLLAIDETGALILIELKRDQTPREVVAQAIDYASWIDTLSADRISDVFQQFVRVYRPDLQGLTLDAAFRNVFLFDLPADELNASHQIVIVSSRLDDSTERIVRYLYKRGVLINAVFFRVFSDQGQRYLSRAWFIDPGEVQTKAQAPGDDGSQQLPFNGYSYVSFGHGERRHWEDAVKYGFISGGGAPWYSKTLRILKPGDRILVNVPRVGYVGAGVVQEPVVKVGDFLVGLDNGRRVPVTQVPVQASEMFKDADSDDDAEHLVRVRWEKTLPVEAAVKEVGLFGNQNTVCQPTTPKWEHTVKRVKELFGLTSF